jgi:squalene cyclase
LEVEKITLHYDIEKFIFENGSVADKLRLISAGYIGAKKNSAAVIEELKGILNPDGGVPFNFERGNPSSVKETSEILPLIIYLKKKEPDLIKRMVDFLISRQKGDGGFAEALNVDPYIEDKWGGVTGREWYPVGKSITWLTGKALEALCLAKIDDESRIWKARDFLLYSQNEDGNWPDYKEQNISDPLGTGNILPALTASGVEPNNKVFESGKAALLHHLKNSLETASHLDMVDLIAVGKPNSEKELAVLNEGLKLISSTQNKDGGWSQIGVKKSDPELSSILAFVVKRCC